MNSKICIGIFYIFFVLHLEVCLTQTSTDENGDDVSSMEQDIENLEYDKNEDFENIENHIFEVIENLDSDIDLKNFKKGYKKHNEMDENQSEERSKEKQAGDYADLFGTNQHYSIPTNYEDFGRRFVLSYPYFEKNTANNAAEAALDNAAKEYLVAKKIANKLTPMKAPPEFVLAIAKESAILEAAKPKNPADEVIKKDILRTGDYWDSVWKEDVDPDKVLRSSNDNQNKLKPLTVEISPGSKLYDLISVLKQKSPRLLYVINKNNYE